MDYHKTPLEFPPEANQGDLITTVRAYEARRVQGWGLCWYFAAEIADRFYTAHGIEPRTILHEGSGFLGIRLVQHACPGVFGRGAVLGKITIAGKPENWAPDAPNYESDWDDILKDAAENQLCHVLQEMHLPEDGWPKHANCPHRHRGPAYSLMFSLAALFSMRHDVDSGRSVINEKSALKELARRHDPEYDDREETTYFLFRGRHDLLVSGDGRIILPGPLGDYYDFWTLHLMGLSTEYLLWSIETAVDEGKIVQ